MLTPEPKPKSPPPAPKPQESNTVFWIAGVLAIIALPMIWFKKPTTETPPVVPTYTYRAAAEELVRQKLRDPSSAEFSGVRVIPGTGGNATIVCGRVTARNGFGGMAGAQRFVVGGITSLESEVGFENMEQLWARFCT